MKPSTYFLLECDLPLSTEDRDLVQRFNLTVAEVAKTAIQDLPILQITSGLNHIEPFKYSMQFPYRKASNYFVVMVRDAAMTMGILSQFLQPRPGS